MIKQAIIYEEEHFEWPIYLHAACGLLSDRGIYIVGGRNQEWTDKAYYYDMWKTKDEIKRNDLNIL